MAAWTEQQWVTEGRHILLDMLGEMDAALWPEIEALASERRWRDGRRVDTNHMVTARIQLEAEGLIARTRSGTRGGRAEIDAWHLPIIRGNGTRVDRAAATKRLLYARWYGWAVGDARYPNGFVGVGGERMARASFQAAGANLYLPAELGFGEVRFALGQRVEPGTLDSGAWMLPRPGGIAGLPLFVPVEVKNIREWIFPSSHQLYQVLEKAANLQAHSPGQLLAPLLICRRRHIQTFYMAKDLGFMVLELHRQFLLPSADYTEEDVDDVRRGIGLWYLTVHRSAGPASCAASQHDSSGTGDRPSRALADPRLEIRRLVLRPGERQGGQGRLGRGPRRVARGSYGPAGYGRGVVALTRDRLVEHVCRLALLRACDVAIDLHRGPARGVPK